MAIDAGKARRLEFAAAEARDQARRPAQPARQHEMLDGKGHAKEARPRRAASPALSRPQRKHEASSTIQLKSSPNECPACAAISGTSDVGVMPGWVLTSSQMSSPFSEWRSS